MEKAGILLLGVLMVLMVAGIAVYNHFDRLRFRLERNLHAVREPMAQWVRACAALRGGDDGGYFKLKRLSDKTACIRRLIEETTENSEEKLAIQQGLSSFCGSFNFLAENYDRQLQDSVGGKIAMKMGFRPVGRIDFFPDVNV